MLNTRNIHDVSSNIDLSPIFLQALSDQVKHLTYMLENQLEVRVETLEETASDHKTRIAAAESDVSGN